MSKGIWSDHLVRRFARLNSLRVLKGEEAYVTRESSPDGMSPSSLFVGNATMVFRDLGGYYRGSGLVKYNCLTPSVLFKNIDVEVWLYNPKTIREIVAEVARRYGVPIDPAWAVDGPFDFTVLPKTVQIEFKRTNFTNQDFLNVTVRRADADVGQIFKSTVLSSPKVPFTLLDSRTNAEFSYQYDFTPSNPEEVKQLKEYPAGLITDLSQYRDVPAMTVLSDLIAARTDWKPQFEVAAGLTASDLCFRGSQLVYNGRSINYVPAEPHLPSADTWYENVLVVRFDATHSGVQGLAFFHYNNLG